MLPTFLCIFFLQEGVLGRSHLPFLPTPEGIEVNDLVSRSLGLPDSNGVRRPRNAVSVLSLLWPQVVGPIENGIIKEEGYDEIPKTTLEQQLEGIRQKSKQQTLMRAHVRDLINHGAAPTQLTLQELYALNNEMGGYHPHPAHPIFHPLAHPLPPPPPYHPQGMPFFDSIVIQDPHLSPFPNDHRHSKKLTISDTTEHPLDNKHHDKLLDETIKFPQDITDFLNHFGGPISSDHKNDSVNGDHHKVMSLSHDDSSKLPNEVNHDYSDSQSLASEVNDHHIDGSNLPTEVNNHHTQIDDLNFPAFSHEANPHHINKMNLPSEVNYHHSGSHIDGSSFPTEANHDHSNSQNYGSSFPTEVNHDHSDSHIDGRIFPDGVNHDHSNSQSHGSSLPTEANQHHVNSHYNDGNVSTEVNHESTSHIHDLASEVKHHHHQLS